MKLSRKVVITLEMNPRAVLLWDRTVDNASAYVARFRFSITPARINYTLDEKPLIYSVVMKALDFSGRILIDEHVKRLKILREG